MTDLTLRKFDGWRKHNPQICFFGSVGSGSLLLGSSIAYPILSQDSSGWSSVALSTFFVSAGLFNTFKILEIYLYGHYTLAICIFTMILNMASGQISSLDQVRFIPVYFMGSTFLTAAWPSLFWSLGLRPKTLDDVAASHDYTRLPMSEVHVDDDNHEDIFGNYTGTGSPLEDWFHEIQRLDSPSLLVAMPTPSEQGEAQPSRKPTVCRPASPGTLHMGPSSNYSAPTHHSDTSISLGSQGGCPSEMSSNVVTHFFQELAPNRHLMTTQRRRDIQSLGREFFRRDSVHQKAKAVRDETDLINTVLRKAQSM
ncbi:hypothetical protein N0V93_001457 [Gnomoniopsis smithogilvyi]|uniref:Uncharacterized protein n=1 Tax=Gnomoniopsis smithogilvyi TaxID=1191159 RepID=A0A9W9D1P3_9PEZI|nr:hypothetical protein N0V93_001457 [Gnomoniopsis smithogilvyi]